MIEKDVNVNRYHMSLFLGCTFSIVLTPLKSECIVLHTFLKVVVGQIAVVEFSLPVMHALNCLSCWHKSIIATPCNKSQEIIKEILQGKDMNLTCCLKTFY